MLIIKSFFTLFVEERTITKDYMKTPVRILKVFILCSLVLGAGCEPGTTGESPAKNDNSLSVSAYTHYAPVTVKIMPLTEVTSAGDNDEEAKINVYVCLLDLFGCQMKSPGIFRFELYERVLRSGEPKGGRVVIWPNIDLTEAVENNSYWRDFLRAYEFSLDFEPQGNKRYILQVTCLCPNGKRLLDEFALGFVK